MWLIMEKKDFIQIGVEKILPILKGKTVFEIQLILKELERQVESKAKL